MPAAIVLVKRGPLTEDLQQNEAVGQRLDEFSRDQWEHLVIEGRLLTFITVRLLKRFASAVEPTPPKVEANEKHNRPRRMGYDRKTHGFNENRVRLGRRIGE